MFVNAQIRPYGCQANIMGRSQRVAASHAGETSVQLRRVIIFSLCAALFLVMACGQFLHWRIMSSHQAAEQLQSASLVLNVDCLNLLAKRARLLTPEHVQAVAAVRLDLHVPGQGQVHRL